MSLFHPFFHDHDLFDDWDLHPLARPLMPGMMTRPDMPAHTHGGRGQKRQALPSGDRGMIGGQRGQMVARPRETGLGMWDNTRGFWDWDQMLTEPMTLGLDDNGDHYLMDIRRPKGLHAKDLKLELQDDMLTVHGEHSREHKKDDGTYESRSTSFSRSIRLPANVDASKISAKYMDNGRRLHIELPKLPEEQFAPKRIAIQGAEDKLESGQMSGNMNMNQGNMGAQPMRMEKDTGLRTGKTNEERKASM